MATKESIDGGFAGMWKITGSHEFNQKVVHTYQQEARNRKSTLVFCANLAVMRDLTTKFKNAGIKAESVSTKTPQVKRLKVIDDFKQQKLAVILNCEVFREGADLPSVSFTHSSQLTKLTRIGGLHHSRQSYFESKHVQPDGMRLLKLC
jgi:superfamily II DNA/RNA helicase